MKTLTVDEAARKFTRVVEDVERDQEEVVLLRKRRAVARIVPEPPAQNALTVLGDLYRILDDETGKTLARAVRAARHRKSGKLSELQNPWAT